MDNLVDLRLKDSGIEVVPSSIGQYCTNLLSLDLRKCRSLQSIEGNFRLLKHLKGFYLDRCYELKNIPTEGLFDVKCCLQELSFSWTSFKNLYNQGAVNNEILGFSRFLTRLSLSFCNLVDEDISFLFCEEFPNLQALDLSQNKFSRLHSSLSQLPRLKYLNVSGCDSLVELPDLPSSIAILIAIGCESLKVVGDFPTNNLKWLWRVSLSASNCNGERVLQSMLLQGNTVEDYFISIQFDGTCITIRGSKLRIFTLLLPPNWYDEFSGFLVYFDDQDMGNLVEIIIKDVMGWENEDDVLEVSNEDEEWANMSSICYISFVPKRSQGDDSIERAKDTTNSSEYWDEEAKDEKTFEIIHDSKSSIKIERCHHYYLEMPFHRL